MVAKERELSAREAAFIEKESHIQAILSQKDTEIASLQQHVVDCQSAVDTRIRQAITKREEELRVAVMKREEEVAAARRGGRGRSRFGPRWRRLLKNGRSG